MVKTLISGPTLARLSQIWAPKTFSWVLPLLDVRHYRKLSPYAISRKTYVPNTRKWQKTSFCIWFRPVGFKIGPPFFFFFFFFSRNLAFSVTRYRGQLSSCKISAKIMIQSSETLVTGGQMNRRTDRKTDEGDFKGRCPTNVEHPTRNQYHFCIHFFFNTCMIKWWIK